MTQIGFYYSWYGVRIPIYGIRSIPSGIVNRLRRAIPNFADVCVQVCIVAFGSFVWINLSKRDVYLDKGLRHEQTNPCLSRVF